ncbi:hypothetical protein [Rhizobium sp. SL42]|uniref:hypothetical protein n=1 Tax=Rhizobium sp. SL42 TaxID=2806346 RepID=UPI001F216C74|nr:hypothetical protein [Rhizobium sp. SL42]UJW77692.1 hypothetical protein IM739_22495 [Rhizobium sp. SL42]
MAYRKRTKAQKPRVGSSALTPQKRQVRVSKGAHDALLSIRNEAPSVAALSRTLEWTLARYKYRRYLVSLLPRTPSQLPDYVLAAGDRLEDALKWQIAAITAAQRKIERHNRNAYTSIDQVTDHTSSFESATVEMQTCMWSYSAASQALFSLAKSKGLDAQRRWMQGSVYVSNPSISNIILYSKGIASEGDRHPVDIMEVLNRFIFSKMVDDELNLLLYYLTFNPPLNLEVAAKLSPLLLYFPLVDQYEFLANLVTSDPNSSTPDSFPFSADFIQLLSATGDWRGKARAMVAENIESTLLLPIMNRWCGYLLDSIGVLDGLSSAPDRELDIALANEFFHQPQSPRAYLASSLFAMKSAQNLEDVKSAIYRREIASAHFESMELNPEHIERRPVGLTFDTMLVEVGNSDSVYENRELFRIACICGISEGRTLDTLILLYNYTSRDPLAAGYFPASLFSTSITEDEVADVGHDARAAIALSRVAGSLGDEGQNLVYIAVEQHLNERGVSKPSDLTIGELIDIAFLSESCTSASLRQSLEFLSKAEMEEERIKVLFNLAQANLEREDEYIDEVHAIIGQQTIEELLQRFHVGKVQCDEQALATWALTELSPKFNRLKDFIDAGLPPVEKNADVEFIAHLTSGKSETFTFKVPNNESLDIARTILAELNQKYALDPRYGVDSYLSLGMRHGAVEAHLQSPLSAENILTTKDPLGYPDDCFWKGYFIDNGYEYNGEKIGPILARFSEKFDNKLEAIKNDLLQVRRPDKPEGLIVADWSEASVLSACARFAEVVDFEAFINEFTSIFWTIIEKNLSDAREFIENVLSNELNGLIDELEDDVRQATGQQRLPPFSDALMRARQELSNAVRDISSWHNVARSTDVEPLGLVEIISAAQKIVCRLYPDFQPRVTFSGDTGISVTYSLQVLIEVFKALFTNVYAHSEVEQPTVNIHMIMSGDDALDVEFVSDCKDLDKAEQAASDNNEKIRTGEYEKKLPKEGGSGLAKVARSTLRDGKPNTIISVDHEAEKFRVGMTFRIIQF